MSMWGRYVPVSERRAKASKKMEKLKKQGKKVEPVCIEGRTITKKFWGKKWCDHLENFADYDNRLPRGKTYVRNGSVCHLSLSKGKCEAIVSGSELYEVVIHIDPLAKSLWEGVKNQCRGKVGSLLELLQGKLSDQVMHVVTDPDTGLFPKLTEFSCSCSCPDWADICKHVAAVFYGIGNRLDDKPELLFKFRGVDASELISTQLSLETSSAENQLITDDLGALFGIELDEAEKKEAPVKEKKKVKKQSTKHKNKAVAKKKVTIDNITGGELRQLREEKVLTVLQFADLLGVTPASIYRWEKNQGPLHLRGHSKESLKRILKCSNA